MKIKFKNEKLPYNIISQNDRYIIASRKINKRQDAWLLWHEVDMWAFISFTDAYKSYKNEYVYTIIDKLEKQRSYSTWTPIYCDFNSKESCDGILQALNNWDAELSRRSMSYDLDFIIIN